MVQYIRAMLNNVDAVIVFVIKWPSLADIIEFVTSPGHIDMPALVGINNQAYIVIRRVNRRLFVLLLFPIWLWGNLLTASGTVGFVVISTNDIFIKGLVEGMGKLNIDNLLKLSDKMPNFGLHKAGPIDHQPLPGTLAQGGYVPLQALLFRPGRGNDTQVILVVFSEESLRLKQLVPGCLLHYNIGDNPLSPSHFS